MIGANHVAVPTHFYKVIVGETPDGKLEMEAYVMPNQVIDGVPLTSFQVSNICKSMEVSLHCYTCHLFVLKALKKYNLRRYMMLTDFIIS